METNCKINIKVETRAALLETEVFLFKIPSGTHPGHCHKAKDWDISNPVGVYKLILLADDEDSCHIQLKDDNGDLFGYSVINCYPGSSGSTSSSSITPVADSSRYFTTKIRKHSSGQDEFVGIGFTSRDESLSLTKTLASYFTTRKRNEVPIKNAEESLALADQNKVPSELFQVHSFQYNCQLCPNGFDTAESLKEHIEKSHESNAPSLLFYCDTEDCGKRFFSQLTLDSHQRIKHNAPPTKRMKSGNYQDQERKLLALNNINPDGAAYHDELKTVFWCPVCPSRSFATTDRKAFFKHLKDESIHRRGTLRICGVCSLLFNNMERFQYHVNALHYACSTCFATLRDEDKLRLHVLKVHRRKLEYKCHLCPRRFSVREPFIEHYKTEHPDPVLDSLKVQHGSNLQPPDPSISQLILNKHKTTEHLENSTPTKRIKFAGDQKEDKKKEKCTTETHNFVDNINGAAYHDELKTTFWCPICPSKTFTFTKLRKVLKHLRNKRMHGMVKPKICYICSLVFNNVERFLPHAITDHYTCSICFAPFMKEVRLRSHLRKVHKQPLSYQCYLCPSNFIVQKLFADHYKAEHPVLVADPRGEQSCNPGIPTDQDSPVSQHTVDNTTKAVVHLKNSPAVEIIECEDEESIDGDEKERELDVELDSLVDNPNGAVYHDELKTAFWCPICPSQSFTTFDKHALFIHLRRRGLHGREQPRICGICSLVFNNVERFLYHANVFHFTCPICNISYEDDEYKLRNHVLESHEQPLKYQCHRCPSNFTVHDLFVEHLKTEHHHPDAEPGGEQSHQ